MTTALDSSVIVAALSAWHERHVECRRAVAALLSGDEPPVIPAHALVEAFSVLTRLPPGYRIAPEDALDLLESAFRPARIVAERASSTWAVLSQAVDVGAAGGSVYDLRILRTAQSAGARWLLTLNPDDFRRLADGGEQDVRIIEP